MTKQKAIESAAYPAAANSPSTPQLQTARPEVGVRIDFHTTLPGPVEIPAAPNHRLLIHAGPPVRGEFRSRRVLYTRGDIDMFPAGASGAWAADDASSGLLLQISPLLLYRAAEGLGLDPDRSGLEVRCQVRDPQIEYITWALDAEHRAGYPSGLLYTESLSVALAVRLLGGYMASPRLPRGLSNEQLRLLTAYIEEHLDQELSLTTLANVVGVSGSHLKTIFRRSTGLPVHEYVIQRRVERARMLLLRGELPASQVALAAGFAHQSHMARWMRRLLGVTPTALMHGPRAPQA
jgi:AraC family transcriptional regulator